MCVCEFGSMHPNEIPLVKGTEFEKKITINIGARKKEPKKPD